MEKRTTRIRTEDLKPYDKNPRHNDKAVEAVKESIRQCGYIAPIIVDENLEILAGHTRLKALKALGIEEVETIIVTGLTEEQKKKYRLLDNKTNELAEWDFDLLEQELEGLDFGGFDFGFDTGDKDDNEVEEDNFQPRIEEETRCKAGDIWALGEHRLICGDATKPEDISRLMAGAEADLLLTDPPYNVDYIGKTKDALTIQNDKQDDAEFEAFLTDAFCAARDALKPGGCFYIWHADTERRAFLAGLQNAGLDVRQVLIWYKSVFVMGRQDYHWKHEPCLYGWKDGAAHYFIDDRTQSTVYDEPKPDIRKMRKEELVDLIERMQEAQTTVLFEKKPSASELHPTMKPVKLMGRLIRNSTRPGETVLDPFGGSGSTLIACQQLNRRCYTAELDPHYADVIIKRFENFTGSTAHRIEE